MKTIIRSRDSGKAKELLTYAQENHATVLTQDKRALQVKADNYGLHDINIMDYEDLENDDYDICTPIVIHNADKFLTYVLDRYYGLNPIGFTATEE